jgi:cellulose synthase/poly-beta-1,6-N-acetylglucosamine synthase-like glycosyltransferase
LTVATEPGVIRELIRLENDALNYRLSWFLTLHGFLFAALAFAWDKGAALILVLCIIGILSSLSVGILLRCGIVAMKRLEEELPTDSRERVIGRGYSESPAIIHFFLPWHFLPILFVGAWAALIVIRVWCVA